MSLITVTITPAGSVSIDAQGFKGAGCEKATEQLELVLGGGQVKRTRKPEYHLPPAASAATIKRTF